VLGPGPKATVCLEAVWAESIKADHQTDEDKQEGLHEAGKKN